MSSYDDRVGFLQRVGYDANQAHTWAVSRFAELPQDVRTRLQSSMFRSRMRQRTRDTGNRFLSLLRRQENQIPDGVYIYNKWGMAIIPELRWGEDQWRDAVTAAKERFGTAGVAVVVRGGKMSPIGLSGDHSRVPVATPDAPGFYNFSFEHMIYRASLLMEMQLPIRSLVARRPFNELGFVYKRVIVDGSDYGGGDIELEIAESPDGLYIGDPSAARYLTKRMGIRKFEKSNPTSTIASVGFNPTERKWYGWSHRSIRGFGLGDPFFNEDEQEGQPISTLAQARLSAANFARSVA